MPQNEEFGSPIDQNPVNLPETEDLLANITARLWPDFADRRRPEDMMDGFYGVVLGVILFFPWSIVAMMVAGTFWGRIRAAAEVRRRR